jgi:tetratricopeptide (TPR) repeat protein
MICVTLRRSLSLPGAAVVIALTFAVPTPLRADEGHDHGHGQPAPVGSVHFIVTCATPAQQAFDQAMALQHSFWYQAAHKGFSAALASDPQCVMGYWGIAMSLLYNPFNPTPPKNLADGAAALAKAREIGARTPREAGYIDALTIYYTDTDRPQPVRAAAYAAAMGTLSNRFPDDSEAAILHALALDVAAPPTDKTYSNQLRAASILEKAFVEQPNHPGVAHYLIHTYDVPALAAKGLPAALRYADLAAAAPHAQHMPSHIFTRVGYWQQSIAANRRAADIAAAENEPSDELHADDYMVYAYLQGAQDAAARIVLTGLPVAMARPGVKRNAVYFAAAAIPARIALERDAWSDAAGLMLHPSEFPYVDAITHFARGIGGARSGDPEAARVDLAALRALGAGLKDAYWAEQIAIQGDVVAAWIADAEHKPEATDLMRAVADREARTEKAPITPGPLAPAREMLGEMLLAHGQAAEALAALEASQQVEPNRFKGLWLAARAAEQTGQPDKAKLYYAKLLEVCGQADTPRPALQHAKAFLGRS